MREEDAAAAYAAALEHALLTIAAAFRRGDDDFAKRMLYLIERRITRPSPRWKPKARRGIRRRRALGFCWDSLDLLP
jgi:hypothetical protein